MNMISTIAVSMTGAMALAASCAGDLDADTITDDMDNCVEIYNPAQGDGDNDGIGDACDSENMISELRVDGCYLSDWPPLRGVNWENRPTYIQQGDINPTSLHVAIAWNGDDAWVEEGNGSTTGEGVWFDIADEHNPYLYTKTIVEGFATDTNGDGMADEIHGTYIMLECDNPDGFCDLYTDYEVWTDGEWHATRTDSLDCSGID